MSCLLQTKRISASTHRRVPLCKTAWRGDGHLTEMPLVPYVVPACVFGSSPAATTAYGNKRDGRPGGEDRREREREGLQTSHSSSSASRGLWMRPVQTTRSEDYSCCLVAYAQKASGAEKGAAAHIELAAVTLMSKVIRRGFFLFLAFLLSLSLSR